MNKKLLLSLGLVTLVLAAAIGGTVAFFSDTETSTGNSFTAGAIDLTIDSKCTYNGEVSTECGTWDSTDLTNEKFFSFLDVKPGDFGENTLSLTVTNNDANACLYIENAVNAENTLVEPEIEAGDTAGEVGELAENLHFTAWLDQGLTAGWQGKNVDTSEGDNVWQGTEKEPLLFSNAAGPASDVLDGKVYDLGVLKGLETNYLGIMWCAGDMTIEGSTIGCSGAAMGNKSQTDSLSADIRFYVEQARHNGDFVCPPLREVVFELQEMSGQNAANQALNRPYITYVINGDTIDFVFHNPTNFYFGFDYRIDGETVDPLFGGGVAGPWANITIGEGELNGEKIGNDYHVVDAAPHTDIPVSITGTEKIWVGLRQGAEQNWYLDWIKFIATEI